MRNNLTKLLGIDCPIIQAPMAGGTTPPALIAAACNAGALGSLGAAYLSPEEIERTIDAIRLLTDRPFAVNLFTYKPPAINDFTDGQIDKLTQCLSPYCDELQIAAPTAATATPKYSQADQLAVVLAKKVPVLSFAFGIPDAEQMKLLKTNGVILLGSATTVNEARLLEKAGADVVVAQGCEAGGHRGTFAGNFETAMIGLMALIPQMVDVIKLPVIAAGGIMDGRGLAAALALGAQGVQMGTAFLLCDEANVQDGYKKAILSSEAEETMITSVFSGRPARGIKNRFMEEMEKHAESILPFPITDSMTKPLRAQARSRGQTDYINLWAGQAGRLAREVPAASLVESTCADAKERLAAINSWLND